MENPKIETENQPQETHGITTNTIINQYTEQEASKEYQALRAGCNLGF